MLDNPQERAVYVRGGVDALETIVRLSQTVGMTEVPVEFLQRYIESMQKNDIEDFVKDPIGELNKTLSQVPEEMRESMLHLLDEVAGKPANTFFSGEPK